MIRFMRKLLNTLFVTSENLYLSLENSNVVAWDGNDRKGQYPLDILESILTFSYKGASPALMGACAKQGIGLSFLTPNGRFLARTVGFEQGNVLLRKKQYRISDCEEQSCAVARNMIFGKVYNARWVIERTIRDHGMRVDTDALRTSSQYLANALPCIKDVVSLDSLRGIEGQCANEYFGVFDEMILNQKDAFRYTTRSRRPPLDRVNALLSFVYMLLSNECASALESVGLDAYVGFMHRDRPGRQSLALDLMEELRPVFADRFALTLINTREIQKNGFTIQDNGAVLLNETGRKTVLSAWQERKKQEITHPYLGEKIVWGLVPYTQALLLARYLRGDMEAYPPFLWK